MTVPGRIASTISAVMSSGLAIPGMAAVVMITSFSARIGVSNRCCWTL